mmetsp:Transcript_36034/g.101457  ORF Transcript_36034/g.101457 Transcript_36034/m.101457 type:complete len:205 (+) Transcript_36034:62-676(+)|eukprot:CAMPEP_0119147942 /NCGR_PEP_ID=MMETSP1310-20130426/41117_1 /TAXON_ID=464262 /ORGANISM="Genus nov. species nov., Strain RCC2339" /LENGTH=204 /DNA_ID=CAMNT_0007139937 /DNA_START=10 /DNA_END=624 /DNA_ORIENTATION=+
MTYFEDVALVLKKMVTSRSWWAGWYKNFDWDRDLPSLMAFFIAFFSTLYVLFQIGRSMGLFRRSWFFGAMKSPKVTSKPTSTEDFVFIKLIPETFRIRAVNIDTDEGVWELPYVDIKQWGHTENAFQLVYRNKKGREENLIFATKEGQMISESVTENINRLAKTLDIPTAAGAAASGAPAGSSSQGGEKKKKRKRNRKKQKAPE